MRTTLPPTALRESRIIAPGFDERRQELRKKYYHSVCQRFLDRAKGRAKPSGLLAVCAIKLRAHQVAARFLYRRLGSPYILRHHEFSIIEP